MNYIVEKDFDNFLENIKKESILVQKYGSLLTEQTKLLELFYELIKSEKEIICLSAPPASGKTHVILLLIKYFLDVNKNVGLILPFQELIDDFKLATKDIENLNSNHFKIFNIAEYLNGIMNFDILFIDEAHNLKSCMELNREFVKKLVINKNHEFYNLFKNRTLLSNVGNRSFRLNTLTLKEILEILKNESNFNVVIEEIYSNLSEWIGFIYINSWRIEIFIVKANFGKSFPVNAKKIVFFSATPLNKDELKFYCGINEERMEIGDILQPKSKQRRIKCFYLLQNIDEALKIKFTKSLLSEFLKKTLILTNSSYTSQVVFNQLKLNHRKLFLIPANIQSNERKKIFKEFDLLHDGVLISSSNVFWEGINIKNLELLIIFDIPFPKPSLMELYQGTRLNVKNLIRRRLIQGIGRIGRKAENFGVAILLFDPSIYIRRLDILGINIWDAIPLVKKEFNM
jgi:Rad3-related DNA helicase